MNKEKFVKYLKKLKRNPKSREAYCKSVAIFDKFLGNKTIEDSSLVDIENAINLDFDYVHLAHYYICLDDTDWDRRFACVKMWETKYLKKVKLNFFKKAIAISNSEIKKLNELQFLSAFDLFVEIDSNDKIMELSIASNIDESILKEVLQFIHLLTLTLFNESVLLLYMFGIKTFKQLSECNELELFENLQKYKSENNLKLRLSKTESLEYNIRMAKFILKNCESEICN